MIGLLAVLACQVPPGTVGDTNLGGVSDAGWTSDEVGLLRTLRLVDDLPPDPTNRVADDSRAVAWGRQLFYDRGLSPTGRFACATCHDPARHFTDALPLAVAAGTAARHTPTIEGAQLGPWYFWDGRADSLWAQAIGPLESGVEMDSDRLTVARRVAATWREPYQQLFGPLPDLSDEGRFPARARPEPGSPADPLTVAWSSMSEADQEAVTQVLVNTVKAIAAFERTVLPGEAAFDRYVDAVVAGDPAGGGHLDAAQVRGLQYFVRHGACASCHLGPLFTDRAFHNLGLPAVSGYDPGRGVGAARVRSSPFNCEGPWSDADDCPELRYLNPDFPDFVAAFKTPTLRNVTLTAPYTHIGQFSDLDAVLSFYSELPGQPSAGHRELTLRPLEITADQKQDLVAFLRALEAPVRPGSLPP